VEEEVEGVPGYIAREELEVSAGAWGDWTRISINYNYKQDCRSGTYLVSMRATSNSLKNVARLGTPKRLRSVISRQGWVESKYSAARRSDSALEIPRERSSSSGRRTQ
jgi:hypothetical protein